MKKILLLLLLISIIYGCGKDKTSPAEQPLPVTPIMHHWITIDRTDEYYYNNIVYQQIELTGVKDAFYYQFNSDNTFEEVPLEDGSVKYTGIYKINNDTTLNITRNTPVNITTEPTICTIKKLTADSLILYYTRTQGKFIIISTIKFRR